MLYLVESSDRSKFVSLLNEMFVLRARVFGERLQWDVDVIDGREVDRFDVEDPVYLLAVNPVTRRLEGSVRLLPTTGPNMLRDVFPILLPYGVTVEHPLIWESSRFCIEPDLVHSGQHRINRVTSELLCGLVEIAMSVGLTHIVSVYDARMARIFRSANCPAETIGTPTKIGRVMTYAGLFETNQMLWDRIAATAGINDPLLLKPTAVAASAA
jgi:N-acyl-L-homoserine lactone synthetase